MGWKDLLWAALGLLVSLVILIPEHLWRGAKELWLTWKGKSKNVKIHG